MNTLNFDEMVDFDNGSMLMEESIEITMVDQEDSYAPLMYEDLPASYRDFLDGSASELLDPHKGHIAIIGTPQTGKSFLIDQIVGNFDRYLDRVGRKAMHFIKVDEDDMDTIFSLPNRYQSYIELILNQLDCNEHDICFVTEDPNVAAKLFSFTKRARIILEASHSTFEGIAQMENNGMTKIWGSWRFVDTNEIFLKKNELVNLLHLSLHDKIAETFKVEINKNIISTFLNYCLKENPDLLGTDEDNKKLVLVPAGIWATVIRRMGGILGLSEASELKHNKKIVLGRVYSKVYKENEDLFEYFIPSDESAIARFVIHSSDGNPIRVPLPPGLFEHLANDDDDDEDESVEVKPLEFNEISLLEEKVREEILGQDGAVETVVDSMIVPAAGLNDDTKPIKSMLFLGPTGTGKTKMAMTIAEHLATEPMNLVRIDMSEYSQPHEAAKLLGAPPGYAGFDKGGVLTNAVKANPNSLILLDEIEKADPKIWDSFLQIFDAGRMTDGTGNTVDFTQTVIVMTSNIGAGEVKKRSMGFAMGDEKSAYEQRQKDSKAIITKALEAEFRPELINRIDELVIFNELSKETSRQIVRKEIEIINQRLQKRGYELGDISNDIIDEILSKSNVSAYGAREIQRVILRNLSSPIAKTIVKNKDLNSNKLILTLDKDKNISVKN